MGPRRGRQRRGAGGRSPESQLVVLSSLVKRRETFGRFLAEEPERNDLPIICLFAPWRRHRSISELRLCAFVAPCQETKLLRSRQEINYPFGLPFCFLAASLLNYRTKAMRIRRSLPGNKISKPTNQFISCRLLKQLAKARS